MHRTLRWRLAIPYVILVIVTMVGLNIYLVSYVRQTYQANLKSSLTADARIVATAALPFLGPRTSPSAITNLSQRYANLLNARITIFAPNGSVLAETQADQASVESSFLDPEVHFAISGQEASDIRYDDSLHTDQLFVAVPIRIDNQVAAAARLAIPLTLLEANLARIRQTVIAVTLLAILLTAGLSTLLSSYTIQPLKEITKAAQHLAEGDFDTTLLPTAQDEIGQLNLAFNQMAIRLSDQIEALQAEQGKLEAVLSQMTDGVLIADREGHVVLINPAAERMFAVPDQNALGRSLVEVVRHHQIVDLWRKCQATGEQQITTLELATERLFIQGIASPLKQAIPGSSLLLFQDLTRMRRLETVRQDFISNVSHELRTPLASLKALTETLQEGALEDPPAARRFLFRMDSEIDTLTQMVRELLELSRIESGRVPLQRRVLAPRDLASPSIERMVLQAERAGLKLHLDCCPENLPAVSADPDRMEQVLVNLVHNAIKFTPPGGEITVSAYEDGDKIVFCVRDTGVGIAAKDLPRIFERFYKADRARSGGGTGLGLSIARHLIEAHGGKIWAESIQGQGSTFYFSLPVAGK